jgi:DNA-binding Lrp family transcriptional regulator
MSHEEQREESALLQDVAQQLNLYDGLFPQVENKELQVLFALIRIYLARCDNPGLRREHIMINQQLMKRLILTYFDPFTTPIERGLREALISRLNSMKRYRITNSEVIRRALVTCFYDKEPRVRRRQKTYLDVFMRNPGESFTKIAKVVGVTPQAVSTAYRFMQKSDVFKFWGLINYRAFNLRHFMVFFTTMREYRGNSEFLRKLFFEGLPFTLSLNSDVYEGSSWASFVIPNQNKELREFKESLSGLRDEVFRELTISEFNSVSTGSNLEFFDGRRWFFDPQLWTYGFFEFVRENKEILRKATELRYSNQPIRFDRRDFSIATILSADPLLSHNEIRKRLAEFGFRMSRPTITRKVSRLLSPQVPTSDVDYKCPTIYSYGAYSGLGLNNLSLYLIECDDKVAEDMYYAVGYLPYYFLYRTDKGVLLSIRTSSEDIAKFNYMIRGMNEIRVVAYSNRFESMGIRSLAGLHEKWDENKQKWICADHELDFVKRFQELP